MSRDGPTYFGALELFNATVTKKLERSLVDLGKLEEPMRGPHFPEHFVREFPIFVEPIGPGIPGASGH